MAEGLVGGEGFAVDASLVKADANRQSGTDGAKGLDPEVTNRATQEYLAVLDDAAFGAATPVVPKYLAPADPASRWTGANGGMAFYAFASYSFNLRHWRRALTPGRIGGCRKRPPVDLHRNRPFGLRKSHPG
jgi:hypothetical protein